MRLLKRIDILFFAYLIISTLLLVLSWDTSIHSFSLIWVRIIILNVLGALIYLDSRITNPVIRLFRLAYPLVLSGYFYSETVFYNKLLFDNIDPVLINLENALFGFQPSFAFSSQFNSMFFSELMYFAYFSFYLLILGFTFYVFLKKKAFFEELVFKLSAALYLFYLIFSFVPSAGPQFYFSYPDNTLPDAWFFDRIMHFIQRMAEQPTGAFPSSHVGVSIIILWLSKKYAPQFFKVVWPFVVLLILSTVYIKAHYAVDVIGGLLIAPFILFLCNYLFLFPNLDKPEEIERIG
ncbi:MAG: phosphatase PAP2 family protein [Bacteroidales bacterium]|nr:phosphatase PAP2 family protein [Bacteroidales bacterium]MCF8457042.1 phosphatase PAP2 family protein [Bacteroidales bacterium]